MQTYDYGVTARVTCTITDVADAAVDPATVTFKFKKPNGVVTTYVYGTDAELVKQSTGIYYVDLFCNAGGIWSWQCYSTAPAGAKQDRFLISDSVI